MTDWRMKDNDEWRPLVNDKHKTMGKNLWINNEVRVGIDEIDPDGSGSLLEMVKLSRVVSQINPDQSQLSPKTSS